MIDDNLAYVAPWGFDPASVAAAVLFMHGRADRIGSSSHSEWLAGHRANAELVPTPDDGHISIRNSGVVALDGLLARAHAR